MAAPSLYGCRCGKTYDVESSLSSHQHYCKVYMGDQEETRANLKRKLLERQSSKKKNKKEKAGVGL